jgi:hypothetical protein
MRITRRASARKQSATQRCNPEISQLLRHASVQATELPHLAGISISSHVPDEMFSSFSSWGKHRHQDSGSGFIN